MVYNTRNYWVFGLHVPFGILKEHQKARCFGNWFYFHSQVRGETPVLLGPLEIRPRTVGRILGPMIEADSFYHTQQSVCVCVPLHLRMET
jgi:hypothetical protein